VVTCNDYQREVAVTQTIASKQIDRVFTFDKVRIRMLLLLSVVCF
jgi:kinesin family protein 11